MTQDVLARDTGVKQPAISKVERGLTDAPLDVVGRLFAALGLQLRTGVEHLDAHVDDAHVDAEIERLAILPMDERLSEWAYPLRKLVFAPVVFEGPIAALPQGVALPVDALDVVLRTDAAEHLAAFLLRAGSPALE